MARTDRPEEDYRAAIRRAALRSESFQGLALSDPEGGTADGWIRIRVRPVEIKGEHHLQFNYFTPTQCITKNYAGRELRRKLNEALALPFRQIHLQSTSGDIHVHAREDGSRRIIRREPSKPDQVPDLSHDRRKDYELPPERAGEFLQAVGIADAEGRVMPSMRGKFRQVNEFLRVISQTVAECDWAADGVHIVDCGCGKAYLTFAARHYLAQVRNLPTCVVGIDTSPDLIAGVGRLRERLGWSGLDFHVSRILDFQPERTPDVVLSLHACDTATDEALARGVEWGSRVILAAPCCQHELHHELEAPSFRPVTRHGILRERLADILTDAFRALALRAVGYRTRVIEFVDPEATAKNVMIRAERGLKPWHQPSLCEYRELADFWDVDPCIGRLLGEEFRRRTEGA